ALGIALVIVVDSVSAGMGRAQDRVLQSLYGLSRESAAAAGPVSSVESSYSCPHQSSSGPVGLPPC
ncbi:hypothetical protein ABZX56_32295, partial [Streptomyces parvulus]